MLPAVDEEDAVQYTFAAVWRGTAGHRPGGIAGGWLWGIARCRSRKGVERGDNASVVQPAERARAPCGEVAGLARSGPGSPDHSFAHRGREHAPRRRRRGPPAPRWRSWIGGRSYFVARRRSWRRAVWSTTWATHSWSGATAQCCTRGDHDDGHGRTRAHRLRWISPTRRPIAAPGASPRVTVGPKACRRSVRSRSTNSSIRPCDNGPDAMNDVGR